MKTIASLILVAFVLLPFFITVISAAVRILSKNHETATTSTLAVPLIPGRLRSRRRLLYFVLSLYGVLLLAAVSFFFIEVIAPFMDLQQKGTIFVVIFLLIMIIETAVFGYLNYRRTSKYFPVSEEGLTDKDYLTLWNKYTDQFFKNFIRPFLYFFGIFLLTLALWVLAVYYLG